MVNGDINTNKGQTMTVATLSETIESTPAFDAITACMNIMEAHEIVEMLGKDRDNFDHIMLVIKMIEPKVTELYEHLAGITQ